MFETRREKLNKCIAELNEYNCVLCNVTNEKYDNEKAKKDQPVEKVKQKLGFFA